MISYGTRIGTIVITEQFLSKLIGFQVTSCFGVVGMVPRGSRQRIIDVFSKGKAIDTGIKVSGDSETIDVEIHIVVTYGMNINAIATSITEKVKYTVKEITGITVDKVSVKVDDIKE